MAHLTIVPEDNAISKGGEGFGALDLTSCNIPANVNALQWDGTSGWVEFVTSVENEDITELPAWAIAAEAVWQTAKDAKDAEEAANAEPVQPADYMVDRDSDIETKLNQYKKVDPSTLSSLSKSFSGLYVEPFTRGHDAAIIGVEIHVPADDKKTVQEGSITMLSVRSVKEHYASKGVPIITRAEKTYAHRAEEMHNSLVNIGYDVVHSNGNMWYFTPWTLDMAKANKKASINVERDTSIANGYNDGTNTWDIDAQSIALMTAKTVGLADGESVTWRTKTNTNVTMTGADFKTLVENADGAVESIYQNSWTRKAAVDSASTENALDAI